jgi:hypothetical protein
MSSTLQLLIFASAAFATELAAAPVLASRDASRPGFPHGLLQYVTWQSSTCARADSPRRYLPNIPVNVAALAVFTVIAIAQTALHFRYKSRYMLYMTVGAWCACLFSSFWWPTQLIALSSLRRRHRLPFRVPQQLQQPRHLSHPELVHHSLSVRFHCLDLRHTRSIRRPDRRRRPCAY